MNRHLQIGLRARPALLVTLLLLTSDLSAQIFGRDGRPLPEPGQGAPGAQSCLIDSAFPGCEDEACEAEVCAIDSYCCNGQWDGICVTEAYALCGDPTAGDRATFNVSKVFDDGNPGQVEVTLSCNTGLPIEQSKLISEDDDVTFVVTNYDDGEMDCEVTESVPEGYEPTYDTGFVSDESHESCSWTELPFGARGECEITNYPIPVSVIIHKEWVIEGSDSLNGVSEEYRIDLYCNSEILGGSDYGNQWHQWWSGEGEDTFSAEVVPNYPNSTCSVEETVYDSAIEVDNGCAEFQVSAANGHECTIINTVFFEGIPALGNYGLAILAMLMLGIGFVGFRRLA